MCDIRIFELGGNFGFRALSNFQLHVLKYLLESEQKNSREFRLSIFLLLSLLRVVLKSTWTKNVRAEIYPNSKEIAQQMGFKHENISFTRDQKTENHLEPQIWLV